jgi:hypothetical protein
MFTVIVWKMVLFRVQGIHLPINNSIGIEFLSKELGVLHFGINLFVK